MVVEKKITIRHKQGLHARPAALFVQIANKFESIISVKKGEQEVNGKSIMGILMLAAERGSEISLKADGEDARKAVEELGKLLAGDSDEGK